jgi:hypothetical protein
MQFRGKPGRRESDGKLREGGATMTRKVFGRRFGLGGLLLIAAVVLFLLGAFGASLGDLKLIPLGLAAFAASFLLS